MSGTSHVGFGRSRTPNHYVGAGCMKLLGCSGDLVNRLSYGPYAASYGFLWVLLGDAKQTY